MKTFLCWLLLLASCATAFGQEAETEKIDPSMGAPAVARSQEMRAEAARLIRSSANNERAWGAYLAGLHGLQDQAPALVEILKDTSLGSGHEENLVRQAALDSLIRLGANVPADVLRALPQNFSDEVIILLAAAPNENKAALLEMFAERDADEGADVRWLAVGNLLAETKARGFASLLLRGLKVEAEIVVLDREGDEGIGYNGGGGGCGCGGSYQPDAGFPPVSYYALTDEAGRGAVVVAPGRRPVYYVRSTYPGGAGHDDAMQQERDAVRVEYLAALLDTYVEDLKFDERPQHTIVCKEARQCRRELVGVRRGIEESYAALITRLVENEHLDGAADVPQSPSVKFTLYDFRRKSAFPLPDNIKGVEIVIELMNQETDEGEAP